MHFYQTKDELRSPSHHGLIQDVAWSPYKAGLSEVICIQSSEKLLLERLAPMKVQIHIFRWDLGCKMAEGQQEVHKEAHPCNNSQLGMCVRL